MYSIALLLSLLDVGAQHAAPLRQGHPTTCYATRFVSAGVTLGLAKDDLPIDERQMLMAALFQTPHFNQPLCQLIYRGKVETAEVARKLKITDFTPETRHVKNATGWMPLINYSSKKEFAARLLRGRRSAVYYSPPAFSLLEDSQWPHTSEKEGKTVVHSQVMTRVDLVQKLLVDQDRPPQRTPPAAFSSVYRTLEPGCVVTLGEKEALFPIGVVDDRSWFNGGAFRYLMIATPTLMGGFSAGDPQHESQVTPGATKYQLRYRHRGRKDTPSPTACIPFLLEGVVNAGYPVTPDTVGLILTALEKRHGPRYNKNMAMVPGIRRTQTVITMPNDPENTLPRHPNQIRKDTTTVINLLESYEAYESLPPALWQFCVIPNLASKCEDANSEGYACLRELVEANGETAAADLLGRAFASLVLHNMVVDGDGTVFPDSIKKAFRPCEAAMGANPKPFRFNLLLFAVSKSAMVGGGYSLMSSANHVPALERIYATLYPDDLSDMPETEPELRDDDIDLGEVDRIEAAAAKSVQKDVRAADREDERSAKCAAVEAANEDEADF